MGFSYVCMRTDGVAVVILKGAGVVCVRVAIHRMIDFRPFRFNVLPIPFHRFGTFISELEIYLFAVRCAWHGAAMA